MNSTALERALWGFASDCACGSLAKQDRETQRICPMGNVYQGGFRGFSEGAAPTLGPEGFCQVEFPALFGPRKYATGRQAHWPISS